MKTLKLSDETYAKLRRTIEEGIWRLDPTGDPMDTQFSQCRHCYVVEYMPHRKDCGALELMDAFDIPYRVEK